MDKEIVQKQCNCCNRIYAKLDDFLSGTSRWRMASDDCLYFNCSCGSTLVLPQGKYAMYAPENLLSDSARTLFNQLGASRIIPKISVAALEFERLLKDNNSSVKMLAEVLRLEPFLASRILDVANARFHDAKVTSLEQAIASLGRNELSPLVFIAALSTQKVDTHYYTPKQLWLESFLAGFAVEYILPFVPQVKLNKDEGYLLGVLSCAPGKLLQAMFFPDIADKIYMKIRGNINDNYLSWEMVELELDAPRHSLLSEIGAAFWGIPDFVRNLAPVHHDIHEAETANVITFISGNMLALAHDLSLRVCDYPKVMYAQSTKDAFESLDINHKDIMEIINKLCDKRLFLEKLLT